MRFFHLMLYVCIVSFFGKHVHVVEISIAWKVIDIFYVGMVLHILLMKKISVSLKKIVGCFLFVVWIDSTLDEQLYAWLIE